MTILYLEIVILKLVVPIFTCEDRVFVSHIAWALFGYVLFGIMIGVAYCNINEKSQLSFIHNTFSGL